MNILGARQTTADDDPGVIEVVFNDDVAYVASYDEPLYSEVAAWIDAGNEIVPWPNEYTTAMFINQCRQTK